MPIAVHSVAEVAPLIDRVRAAAARTVQAMTRLTASEPDVLEVLRQMKFTTMAWHPLEERALNLIEQVNQTWTCLVTLRALPFLFARHPEAGGFELNLGTEGGTDILSLAPGAVAAETFAAVHPMNNRKLPKDLRKLADACPHVRARYVFFAAPGYKHERRHELERIPGIEVWSVDV